FSDKLTRSRLQRDLSDSTVLRNAGVGFAHLVVALGSLEAGLSRVQLDHGRLKRDLAAHPEVLAEAYQTWLRAEGWATPYERLKELTRGRFVSYDDLKNWVLSLELPEGDRDRLLALTPERYIGLAPQVADDALAAAERLLSRIGTKGE
ncbi:MAG: hypothetical protein KGR26_09445, partial [Cyanobacteria bacterium REEB65]|nr:hypothetical protein [Cyanobacteria bacterium REEB65]